MTNLTRSAAGESASHSVSELLARVQHALETMEAETGRGTGSSLGGPRAPGAAASAAALVRAIREATRLLREARRAGGQTAPGQVAAYRSLVHRILEGAARRSVRLGFVGTPFETEWIDLVLEAAMESDYTVGPLFFSRARAQGDRTLFLLPPSRKESRISWKMAEERVLAIAKSLLALQRQEGIAPVAMLSANSPELALFDLACLVTGTPNVPIPANSPAKQVEFIRCHSGARSLFLGDPALAEVAKDAIAADAPLARVHWLPPHRADAGPVRSFASFLEAGAALTDDDVREAAMRVHSADLATTMYTSGTTGMPKGVPFTQGNLVTKRFARAAAWPELGEGDVFLCYLPLYHTFGRWLEMLGCVFWGSVYAFLDDVSLESMLYAFHWVRPTTFISVPKKWIQLAESVAPLGDDADEAAREDEISQALRETTGGRLRRGLSAAGYLPPSVFRRFHAAGIELHSGFGMTEATGGITMTPPGGYRDDSIGVPLPGIELKVAEDGELLIRGPYVTAEAEDEPKREDGWFATGDIVTTDAEEHLRIVDRKKEIFKNIQGETISPRRIESLFADFDIVERVLVIGDGLDYCTVLIVPTAELREEYGSDPQADAMTLDSPDLRELFAPIVATVNRFLAPFERIVDFALLARDLDPERGELTAKGTPKRKLVAERFADAIRPMYSRDEEYFDVGDVRVRLPRWFFRQSGIPASQVRSDAEGLVASGRRLTIRRVRGGRDGDSIRVGDLLYDPGGDALLLGQICGRAELWLGNEAVRLFAGDGIQRWWRRGRRFDVPTKLRGRPLAEPGAERSRFAERFAEGVASGGPPAELDVLALHELARGLAHPDVEERRAVIDALAGSQPEHSPEIGRLAREILRSTLTDPEIRAYGLRALFPHLSPKSLRAILARELEDPSFLEEAEADVLAEAPLRGDQLDALVKLAWSLAAKDSADSESALTRVLGYLVRQGCRNAPNHLRTRSLLVRLGDRYAKRRERLDALLGEMSRGFRAALGAVELAPGASWESVIEYRGEIPEGERATIRRSLEETTLLPEALALLGASPKPELVPLVPKSLRVTFLGEGTGRSVHLLEWSAGGLGKVPPRFECVLKINRDRAADDIADEIRLLIRTRTGSTGRPVVKAQGGSYPELGVWTEEFVPGRTLDLLVEELLEEGRGEGPADDPGGGRVPELWQFVVASSASLLVDFWNRSGRRLSLRDPAPDKIVLPEHDWQIGRRLVSVADLVPCEHLLDVLESIRTGVLERIRTRLPAHQLGPEANAEAGPEWPVLLSSALEVLGEEEGLALLEAESARESAPASSAAGISPPDDAASGAGTVSRAAAASAVPRFVSSTRRRGFLPVRIRIAARRFRRWAQLNPQATLEARAATLDQIEAAYGLDDLDLERPGSRLQYYRHTVFRGADDNFTREFDEVIARTRAEEPQKAQWHHWVTELREKHAASDDEEFFLARMLYPHLDPKARAVLVHEEDGPQGFGTGVVVESRDTAGDPFRMRRPANPNEISALFREFRRAGFRRVPHAGHEDLLVVTDESGRVIGGLIFRRESDTYVRLEWAVISRHRQGRGIGRALLGEWLQRLTTQGVRVVSTGFFRPSFFAHFGFGVDPRYAGLVKMLRPSSATVNPEAEA